MNTFELRDMLHELRLQFFASKYSTVDQFARYSGFWPADLASDKYSFWNQEKKSFLEKQLGKDDALRETYINNLTERVALTNKIVDMLHSALQQQISSEQLDVKQVGVIIQGIQRLTEIQDKSLALLKIDAIKDDAYNKNKASILDVLRRDKLKEKPERPKRKVLY